MNNISLRISMLFANNDTTTTVLILVAVVVFLLLLYFALTFFAFNTFLKGRRKIQDAQEKVAKDDSFGALKKEGKRWLLCQQHEVLELKNRDNLILKGYFLPTKASSVKALAVLVHGYNGSPFERMEDAKMYLENGFDVFVPYLRAHGKSQGRYIGMGNLDSLDVLEWLNFLISKLPNANKIVLSGNSMGAATVATLLGNPNLPKEVKAAVCDSSFTSVSDEVNFVFKKFSKSLRRHLEKSIEFWCRLLLKYNFTQNTPQENIEKTQTPTFFLHGNDDEVVSVENTKALFEACHAQKELMIVENAAHCMSFVVQREAVTQRVLSFFEKFLGEQQL